MNSERERNEYNGAGLGEYILSLYMYLHMEN